MGQVAPEERDGHRKRDDEDRDLAERRSELAHLSPEPSVECADEQGQQSEDHEGQEDEDDIGHASFLGRGRLPDRMP